MAIPASPNTSVPTLRPEIPGMRLHRLAARTALTLSAVLVLACPLAYAQTPGSPKARPGVTAVAAADPSGPAWSSLTPAQRQALAPLEREWSTIDAQRKAKWLEIATRFPSMPADERRRMQERMTEWAHLTPAERGRARLSFQEAKQLSPQTRQQRWEAYQALSEDDRKALAERAKAKSERPAPVHTTPMAAVPKRSSAASAAAPPAVAKPVAPTVVQVKPGATTTLMTKTPTPPPHQRPGQPKIDVQPSMVDRTTLLPKRGPQGAAARPAPAPSAPTNKP